MLTAKNFIAFIFPAFLFLASIIWDIWSSSYDLSLIISGRTLLIKKLEGIDGLKVTLKEREIDRLFSTEIVIENTGRKLISKDDIIKPMRVVFSDTPILGWALKERHPENLEFAIKVIDQAEMEIEFDVLNRGEKLVLNILTDQEPNKIVGKIRAKNFSTLNMQDHHEGASVARKVPTHALLIIGFSTFYIVFGIYFARKELGPLRRDAYSIEKLETGFSKDELMNFLERNIWHKLTERQRERLTAHIQRTDPEDESSTKKLAYEITYEALNRDPSGIVVLSVLIAFFAFLYGCIQLAVTLLC